MSLPNNNPELEESSDANVADAGTTAAATPGAGGARPASNGNETVPLWVLAACGVALLVAGRILDLGGSGGFFNYHELFRTRYERQPPPGSAEQGPPPKEALVAYMAKGAKIYGTKCIVCHGPEAKGDGANFPALAGSKWATGETERFAMIILNGLKGPMSTGKSYSAGTGMPSQAIPPMSPEDFAGVMTYVRNHFGNNTGDVVTVEMAKNAITISAARPNVGLQVTSDELTADHLKPLKGKALDPKAMVDPVTLAPVFVAAPAKAATPPAATPEAPAKDAPAKDAPPATPNSPEKDTPAKDAPAKETPPPAAPAPETKP